MSGFSLRTTIRFLFLLTRHYSDYKIELNQLKEGLVKKLMREFFIWLVWIIMRSLPFLAFLGVFVIFANKEKLFHIYAIIITIFFFILFSLSFRWGTRKQNWRIAIDKGLKYAKRYGLRRNSSFLSVLKKTKKTRNPFHINKWVIRHQILLCLEEELLEIEEKLKKNYRERLYQKALATEVKIKRLRKKLSL